MMQQEPIRRQTDGSIDTDFYCQRAARLRSAALSDAVRRLLRLLRRSRPVQMRDHQDVAPSG